MDDRTLSHLGIFICAFMDILVLIGLLVHFDIQDLSIFFFLLGMIFLFKSKGSNREGK